MCNLTFMAVVCRFQSSSVDVKHLDVATVCSTKDKLKMRKQKNMLKFNKKTRYSGDPKTGHLNTGNIRNPDVLDVRISNGQPFENRTFMSGFRMVKLA